MPEATSPGASLERAAEGIALLRLSRPARLNALDDQAVRLIGELLDRVDDDDGCRVLIVTGEGRGFCAGFDLSMAGDAPGSEHGETQAWMKRQELFAGLVTRLRGLRQPVIAAVNGPANGAGLGIALAAEIRIAAKSASFNAAFVKVGMSSCDIGVSWLLPRAVGSSRSFEMMLTGRIVQSEEAARIGLVSEVVEDDALMPRALEMAQSIAANSAFAVWMTKRGGWANLESASLAAAIELENRTQILARSTGDLQRAAQALLSRRKAGA
ncbi:enoyl-CoA hydratase/isomerase family protein [Variovorax sp. YR216]|uniref:enoyl-CoA hydratase/isomerase family protein n=1 Tax=Variovorax sp. YR216 TaxID=1882828 RepID=UPI00089C0328|nr:enoyl-CoA hydratase-related protein [Variovorax sp. YR216]SEB21992.1 enoyl-CoA hydratase [Variovorax sp. YR216]